MELNDELIRRLAEETPRDELELLAHVAHLYDAKMSTDPIACYLPHAKQKDFHNAAARYRLFLGGNRSGKTHCSVMEMISYALGFRFWQIPKATYSFPFIQNVDSVPLSARVKNAMGVPLRPPTHGLCVADGFESGILSVIVPKLEKFATPYIKDWHKGVSGILTRVEFVNGSSITFKSYDQATRKFEGASYHWVAFDEPPPEAIWVACRRAMVDYAARAWFTLTPLSEPWLYDRIYMKAVEGDPEYWTTNASFFDNPFRNRDPRFLEDLTSEEAEARIHGRFVHLTGQIYKQWDTNVHVIPAREIPRNWPRYHVVDPHGAKPWAMIWFAVTPDDGIEVYREWPTEPIEKMGSPKYTYDEYVEIIKQIEYGEEIEWRICDPNFGMTGNLSTQKKWVEEMMDRGLDFDATVNDDIDSGHFKVMEYIQWDPKRPVVENNIPRLRVHDVCRNVRVSMERYTIDPKARESQRSTIRPHAKWKDFPDTIRYACMSEPSFVSMKAYAYTEIDSAEALYG